MIPMYLGQVICLELLIVMNEHLIQELVSNIRDPSYLAVAHVHMSDVNKYMVLLPLSAFFNLSQIFSTFKIFTSVGFSIFYRFTTWTNLISVFSSGWITIRVLGVIMKDFDGIEKFKDDAELLRYAEITQKVFLYVQSSYFLSLIDEVAPLIDIII